jgi:hypothetical protein
MITMKNHQQIVSEWLKQIGNKHNIVLQLDEEGHCIVPCANGMHGVIEVPATLDVPAVFICHLFRYPRIRQHNPH